MTDDIDSVADRIKAVPARNGVLRMPRREEAPPRPPDVGAPAVSGGKAHDFSTRCARGVARPSFVAHATPVRSLC